MKAFFKINRPLLDTLKFILGAYAAAMALLVFLYPEIFITHNRRYIGWHDPGVPFQNSFILMTHAFQGGVQLWDRFDQISYAYVALTSGLWTMANVAAASVYYALSGLFSNQSQAVYDVHSIVFYAVTALIRTVGGYLLLRLFTQKRWVIFAALMYLNTVLSSPLITGLVTHNLYSYFPLLLYFILRFLEDWDLRFCACALVTMAICVANSALFALGYFYQMAHVCIIVGLVFAVIKHRPKKGALKAWPLLWAAIAGAVITLPYILMARVLKEDFYVMESGLGDTHGRINNAFHFSKYFTVEGKSFAHPFSFLSKSLDFAHNDYGATWAYLGIGTVILAVIGILFSKNQKKHILWVSILGINLLNVPPYPGNFAGFYNYCAQAFQGHGPMHVQEAAVLFFAMCSSIAHGINALTNPFSFLVRSFHMAALLTPFLFLPLIALGLEVLGHAMKRWRWGVVLKALLCGLFLMDFFLLVVYINANPSKAMTVEKGALDYQNPWLIPLREYSQPQENYIFAHDYIDQCHYGLFYQYTHMARYFQVPNLYIPLHRAYKDLYQDEAMKEYLRRNPQQFDFADFAFSSQNTDYQMILTQNMDSRAIVVDNQGQELPYMLSEGQHSIPTLNRLQQRRSFIFNFSLARHETRGPLAYYFWQLPRDFPSYLSTTVFTKDREQWQLLLDGKPLALAQGLSIKPFSFDVQNARAGTLCIIVPKNYQAKDQPFALDVILPQGFSNVWKNTQDDLGFTYHAPKNGWMVIRWPYDQKWQLSVDGQTRTMYKVNRFFLGFPISQGEHRIELKYWPQTPLRGLILLSIITTFLALIAVMAFGIKNEVLQGELT